MEVVDMLKKVLASAVLFGATFSPQFAHAQFQDNSIRYWYSADFRESDTPFLTPGKNIPKNIFSFTHVDGGNKLGNNFLNVDLLKSNHMDPIVNSPGEGAIEVYAVYRHDVSLNKITKSTKFAFGPIKDVLITGGIDLNTKNTAFAPAKRMPVFGPTVALKVPKGFWDVSLLWDKEWNNNGIVGHGVTFNSAVMVSTAWGVPLFKVGKAPLSFEGFGLLNSTKGKDGFGKGTKPETLLHPKLMYNIASLVGEKHNVSIGVGYEYWNNKFGNDNRTNPGSCAHAPFGELAIHL
jgi:nucleoside-specific outer membrane channel protein Tsx